MEITTVSGPSFFLREIYLSCVSVTDIVEGAVLNEDQTADIIEAGLCFVVEQKALEYLNRSEQCSFNLKRKLLAKGHSKKCIDLALAYLESKNYLSDERFARVWLNNRKINHSEGRIKLLSELLVRGISKNIAEKVLDDFFNENSEEEMCIKAYKKCVKLKKTEEKIISYLINSGFSVKLVNRARDLYESEK